MALTQEQIKAAKGRGFLRNRGTECFSARVVTSGGVYSPEQLERIAHCARTCGSGNIAVTARQNMEVVGIPYDRMDQVVEIIQGEGDTGLLVGGTGPRFRPVTACKGTTCVFGLADTQALAGEFHRRYYLSEAGQKLPHKFKVGVGGCRNSCMKPSLNDFGLEACRKGGETRFKVFVGGTWGKNTRVGDQLSRLLDREEVFLALDKLLIWYRSEADGAERLGAVIDRVGLGALEAAVFGE